MRVGDKKGMQVPSENSLGENYPPRSEQKSSSQQQRPVTNNKSDLGRADPELVEQGTVPAGRQQESRRHAKLLSLSKSLVFATQTPFKQQAVYLSYEANAFLQGEAMDPSDGKLYSPSSGGFSGTYLGNHQGGGIQVQEV